VLVVGCGDVGARRLLLPRVRVLALVRSAGEAARLRALGITPLAGELDDAASLQRLAGLAHRVLHLAPPPGGMPHDARTRALLRALAQRSAPQALVYGSTTGVYGDCAGALVRETRPIRPQTRARRRVPRRRAGCGLRPRRGRARQHPAHPRHLRARPRGRRARAAAQGHAGAGARGRRLHRPHPRRRPGARLRAGAVARPAATVINAGDDSRLKMGAYYDLAAELYGLPRPPRVSRAAAGDALSPMMLSFMGESRRIDNTRLKRELRLRLRYPGPDTGLLS
jgi:nucleoside-diphosphate-sugar epimerase